MASVISIRNLGKTYQMGDIAVHALRSVSLEIEQGEFVSVVGPSGSGKSTLMHILGCLDQPTKGEYFLNGRNVSDLSDDEVSRVRNQQIGFVFQGFNLLTRTSALENVELPLLYNPGKEISSGERHRRAMDALAAVGLKGREHHHPNQLSGGQQQRVAIARALLNHPTLLLADEPTGNLDSRTSIEVMNIFQKLKEERGITIVLITHEHEVAAYGSRIVTCRDGSILSDLPTESRRLAHGELAEMHVARTGEMA